MSGQEPPYWLDEVRSRRWLTIECDGGCNRVAEVASGFGLASCGGWDNDDSSAHLARAGRLTTDCHGLSAGEIDAESTQSHCV